MASLEILRNLAIGDSFFDNLLKTLESLRISITTIKGIIILAMVITEFNDPVKLSFIYKVKSIFSSYKTKFRTSPDNIARDSLTSTTIIKLTPVLLATADSKNKLWEKDNITAKMVICFMVNDKLTMAPIPAYRLIQFPRTKTREASPGKPNSLIVGSNQAEIVSRAPLNFNKLTKK